MALQNAQSQDLVAVKEIKNGALILEDGSFRKIIMVSGINFSLKSEKEQAVITVAYHDFLNGLDFSIQIVVHSRKINIDGYLDRLSGRLKSEPSPLLRSQITEYSKFVREFVSQNAIMEKTFLVVVPWHPATISSQAKSAFSFLPSFGKKKSDEEKKQAEQQDVSHDIAQIDQRVNQVVEGLFTIGLETVVLNNEQLAELLYNFYNPESVERQGIPIPEDVPAQAGETS